MKIDVHQHFWSEPLVAALERRDELPFGRRDGGRFVVHAHGEVPAPIDLGGEVAAQRAALLERDGVDRALIAISTPIGIEALPREQALPLIDAYLDGTLALGEPFAVWGPVALDGLSAADIDAVLARGCVGVSLPAGALASPVALEPLADALARLERHGAPLFVHPGPGLGVGAGPAREGEPPWWAALTTYVQQMQAAWLAFACFLRPAHPRLPVVFTMLAGLAPLLGERLAVRGGPPVDLADELTFYETSSFGATATAAMAAAVGAGQLMYGSDRPVVEPPRDGERGALAANGGWLLSPPARMTGGGNRLQGGS